MTLLFILALVVILVFAAAGVATFAVMLCFYFGGSKEDDFCSF